MKWNEILYAEFPRHSVSLFSSGDCGAVHPNIPFPHQFTLDMLPWPEAPVAWWLGTPPSALSKLGCEHLHIAMERAWTGWPWCLWGATWWSGNLSVFSFSSAGGLGLSGRDPPTHDGSRSYFIIWPQVVAPIVISLSASMFFCPWNKRNSLIFLPTFCFDIKADITSQNGWWEPNRMMLKNVLWQLIRLLCNVKRYFVKFGSYFLSRSPVFSVVSWGWHRLL